MAGHGYGGFVVPGQQCGQEATQVLFRGNVAHSVGMKLNGYGAVIFNPGFGCYEVSHFAAYRNTYNGVTFAFGGSRVVVTKTVLMDHAHGSVGGILQAQGLGQAVIEVNDNIFHMETPIPDCPHRSMCMKTKKVGIESLLVLHAGKFIHMTKEDYQPLNKAKKEGSWGGRVILNRNKFINFR